MSSDAWLFQCQHAYPAGEYCPACGELPSIDALSYAFGRDWDEDDPGEQTDE